MLRPVEKGVANAAAWCREYSETLIVHQGKRKKLAWKLPGTVFLWSTQPKLVRVGIDRLESAGKIPIEFMPQASASFASADVVISSAPPEFTNARKYLLRFHCTVVETAQRKISQPQLDASCQSDEARLSHLERVIQTERLMLLYKQVTKLKNQKCSDLMPGPLSRTTRHSQPLPPKEFLHSYARPTEPADAWGKASENSESRAWQSSPCQAEGREGKDATSSPQCTQAQNQTFSDELLKELDAEVVARISRLESPAPSSPRDLANIGV